MTTFEEAAEEVAGTIWSADLLGLEFCWEQLKSTNDPLERGRWYRLLAQESMALLAERGSAAATADVAKLVSRKQRDYGPQNILKFNHLGLEIRLWDKVARYYNLVGKAEALHESIEDTLMDIVGYCIVGLMLLDGTFELPLSEEKEIPFSPRLAQEIQALEETYGKSSNKGWDVT